VIHLDPLLVLRTGFPCLVAFFLLRHEFLFVALLFPDPSLLFPPLGVVWAWHIYLLSWLSKQLFASFGIERWTSESLFYTHIGCCCWTKLSFLPRLDFDEDCFRRWDCFFMTHEQQLNSTLFGSCRYFHALSSHMMRRQKVGCLFQSISRKSP